MGFNVGGFEPKAVPICHALARTRRHAAKLTSCLPATPTALAAMLQPAGFKPTPVVAEGSQTFTETKATDGFTAKEAISCEENVVRFEAG